MKRITYVLAAAVLAGGLVGCGQGGAKQADPKPAEGVKADERLKPAGRSPGAAGQPAAPKPKAGGAANIP